MMTCYVKHSSIIFFDCGNTVWLNSRVYPSQCMPDKPSIFFVSIKISIIIVSWQNCFYGLGLRFCVMSIAKNISSPLPSQRTFFTLTIIEANTQTDHTGSNFLMSISLVYMLWKSHLTKLDNRILISNMITINIVCEIITFYN